MQRVLLKIDVTKIDKSRLYEGKKGIYLDAALLTNKDGQSQYGDDGMIVQSIPKEARDAGERGPIIGNWRYMTATAQAKANESDTEGNERVPF
jgi:hypothetical protein